MANTNQRGPLSAVVLDEIALEGLEGITIPSLWVYLGDSLKMPLPLPDQIMQCVWDFIKRHDELLFYELPCKRETVQLYHRFEHLDEDFGVPLSPDKVPVTRYKYAPVQDGEIYGSCEYYKERKPIERNELADLSVTEVLERWDTCFVIVGNQNLRYNALTPENVPIPKDLSLPLYCVWEAVGRSRFNGETSAGPWSIQYVCKDSTSLFYYKNRLARCGVIVPQPFTEKRYGRIMACCLLTLPRFRSTHISILNSVIEKLFYMLKEEPDHRLTMVKIRQTFDRKNLFKRIVTTHLFRRIFETKNYPYSEIYGTPRAKKDPNAKERMQLCVQLRNPDIKVRDLFTDEPDVTDESTEAEFHSAKHSFVDMPIVDECYRAAVRHGKRGLSQSEICYYLGACHYTVRSVLRKMVANGLMKSYSVDEGRQRINMYVAIEHAKDLDQKTKDSNLALENLKCAEEPNLSRWESEVRVADIPQITATLTPFEYKENNKHIRDTHTKRILERKTQVIEAIDEHGMISMAQLRGSILRVEQEQGYKDEMCSKSIKRMLYNMHKAGIICVYDICLEYENISRSYRYATHPKIGIDHKVLQSEVLKLKNQLYLSREEARLQKEQKLKEKKQQAAKAAAKKELSSQVGSRKAPKFLISRYMHEFLFYIIVELNEYQEPVEIDEQLLLSWQQIEPALQVAECMQQLAEMNPKPMAYSASISWCTFISPLPKYPDKPAGWVYFIDAMDRMPLSLFNKIFRLDLKADSTLSKYLSHPVLQHVLLRQLPPDTLGQINRIHLQRVYLIVLKLLNNMGLVQVTDRLPFKDPLITWVYLNRRTKIVDTISSEASYVKINPNRSYEELRFEFNSLSDVQQYWTQLHRICVYTKLGFRRNTVERGDPVKELQFLQAVDFDEAPHHDVAKVPGDGLGAAGLSSRLFAHTFRNWSWVVNTRNQPQTVRKGRVVQTTARSKHIRLLAGRKTRPVVKRLQHTHSVATKRALVKKKSGPHDAIDRDALKNMRTLRVKWTKDEDRILKLARAVYLYVSAPVLVLGLLTVGKVCRDIIRQNLGVYNKTTQACVRRIHFMLKTNRHLPEVPAWLHLLQTNEEIQRRYGDNFLQRLKSHFPNRNEFNDAVAIHFIQIMRFLHQQVVHPGGNAIEAKSEALFTIPNSLDEFHKLFRERLLNADEQPVGYQDPNNEFELHVLMAIAVLHSSMCCERDKTLYTSQAFEIYKHYSEEELHAAFSKAHKDALVVVLKRKQIQLLPTQMAGPAYLLSSRYRTRLIFLKIPYVVYDAFFKCWQSLLGTFFGPSSSKSSKQIIELKSPQLGQLFLLGEALTRDIVECNIKLPINILTIDAKQPQSLDSMDRILDHYHSIFDNAPQTEYTKNFESIASEKQVRVKFHPANLSYKIHYTPYDFICKLPARQLHFFCALDHLHQEVTINFSKLHHKDDENDAVIIECPFNCILKHANYVNAVERIVQEKKAVLDELSEIPPQKLLNMAMGGCTMMVQTSNLLTLVRMLESFWREKEAANERKDLGKISSNIKAQKLVDWHELCREILAFDANNDDNEKNDEYEPTLNKEERIARAQDVFVVNLPTLQLSLNEKLRAEATTVMYNGNVVPKSLIETELQRETILQKIIDEARWKYTNNSLETLKAEMKSLGLNAMEWQHLEEVHNFIQSHTLGVTVANLLREFPYTKFLSRALKILSEHYLIKRVGAANVMYAHKSHIRDWVVHTFHIKRLERENMGGTRVGLKRTHQEADDTADAVEETDEASASAKKKRKLSGDNASETEVLGKRVSKPVKRFENECESPKDSTNETVRDIIVTKPQPWLRPNGILNRRVLDRWLGCILTECIARTGCSVQDVCKRFPHMMPVDIMFLLEILCDLQCIHLTQIESASCDLFSAYENIKETLVTELYDPERTFVTAHADAVMRMTVFIGQKKYNTEFI